MQYHTKTEAVFLTFTFRHMFAISCSKQYRSFGRHWYKLEEYLGRWFDGLFNRRTDRLTEGPPSGCGILLTYTRHTERINRINPSQCGWETNSWDNYRTHRSTIQISKTGFVHIFRACIFLDAEGRFGLSPRLYWLCMLCYAMLCSNNVQSASSQPICKT